MRVLQLIDSLHPGGSERMAVNYANALAKYIEGSFLCCTRKEGLLKSQLSPKVEYFFLNKKSSLDLKAVLRLRRLVVENRIDVIQAHSSSWFFALMMKLNFPRVKLVWHDHYGKELHVRNSGFLKLGAKYFDGVISVNSALKEWSEKELGVKKVIFFRNFLPEIYLGESRVEQVAMGGDSNDFKILCLANLRPQKDHMTLLKAFELVVAKHPRVSLHLVGIDEEDEYSARLKNFIKKKDLLGKVYFYGAREEVEKFIDNADLGILSSVSEGLPVALLEYGMGKLPVVCTDVGQCKKVIGQNGFIVSPGEPMAMATAIESYLEDEEKQKIDAARLYHAVKTVYTEAAVVPEVLKFYSTLGKKG